LTILQAIIQGIIQGATEFLPVSSSGHLSLVQHFLGVESPTLLFDVMLHLGTLIAVLAVYYKLVWRLICEFFKMIGDVFTGKFKWSKMNPDRRLLMMLIIGLLPLFLLFLPVPGTGMQIKDFADQWATDNDIIIEGCALVVTSILLTLGTMASHKTAEHHAMHGRSTGSAGGKRQFNTADAFIVGLTQCVAAVFPGLSRSGSTLSAGLLRGINRQTALDYSFVLGIPSILAAVVLELKDAVEAPMENATPMLIGVITAAIVGFFAIKLLRWMVKTDKLPVFAIYTLVLGTIIVVLGILEHTAGWTFVIG
jgi:undecaprenyl-diphosphatase